ncbi:hypothetical protein PanWU01x14_369440, partial [Parasponia andersonii]
SDQCRYQLEVPIRMLELKIVVDECNAFPKHFSPNTAVNLSETLVANTFGLNWPLSASYTSLLESKLL